MFKRKIMKREVYSNSFNRNKYLIIPLFFTLNFFNYSQIAFSEANMDSTNIGVFTNCNNFIVKKEWITEKGCGVDKNSSYKDKISTTTYLARYVGLDKRVEVDFENNKQIGNNDRIFKIEENCGFKGKEYSTYGISTLTTHQILPPKSNEIVHNNCYKKCNKYEELSSLQNGEEILSCKDDQNKTFTKKYKWKILNTDGYELVNNNYYLTEGDCENITASKEYYESDETEKCQIIPDEIREVIVPHNWCNQNVSVNGEKGKWYKFKRGGNAFWLPFYRDYIVKNGQKDFYDKVYNSTNSKNLESRINMALYADRVNENYSCDTLSSEFRNEEFKTSRISFETLLPTYDPLNLAIHKDVNYNYSSPKATTRMFIQGEDLNIKFGKYFLGNQNDVLVLHYGNKGYEKNLKDKVKKVEIEEMVVRTKDNKDYDFSNYDSYYKNYIDSYFFKNAKIGLLDTPNIIYHFEYLPNLLELNLEIGKAIVKDWIMPKTFKDLIDKKNSQWNIKVGELISEKNVIISGNTKFEGTITGQKVYNYGSITGRVDAEIKFDQFNEYNNGNEVFNGYEYDKIMGNNVCFNINGKNEWYRFRRGGPLFFLPLFEDIIREKGISEAYKIVYNAIDMDKILAEYKDDYENSCYLIDLGSKDLLNIDINNELEKTKEFKIYNNIYFNKVNLNNVNLKAYSMKINPMVNMKELNVINLNNHLINDSNAHWKLDKVKVSTKDNKLFNVFNNDTHHNAWYIGGNILEGDEFIAPTITYYSITNDDDTKYMFNKIKYKNVNVHSVKTGYRPIPLDDFNKNIPIHLYIDNLTVETDSIISLGFQGNIIIKNGILYNSSKIKGDIRFIKPNYFTNIGIHEGNVYNALDPFEMIEDPICNKYYAINNEKGKWKRFKTGLVSIWTPMYSNYINKNGKQKLYKALLSKQYFESQIVLEENTNIKLNDNDNFIPNIPCVILKQDFRNEEYNNYINIDITKGTNFSIYNDVNYNITGQNLILDINNNTMTTINSERIKLYDMGGWILKYGTKILFNVKDFRIDTLNNKVQTFFLYTNGVGFNVNNLIAPKVSLAPKEYFDNEVNIKNAILYSFTERADYYKGYNGDKIDIKIDNLELTGGNFILSGHSNFDGNLKTKGRINIYGNFNGDIYTTSENVILDEFGLHNGNTHGYEDIGWEADTK